jgi:hypothetical protein
MKDQRIAQLRAMKERGTLKDKHIEEMLQALSFNNALMAAANRLAMPPEPRTPQESR